MTPDALLGIARDMRAAVVAGTLPRIDAALSLDDAIDSLRANDPSLETPEANPVTLGMIERAQRALHGQLGPTLKDEVEVFLRERAGDVTVQTLDDLKRRLGEFLRWTGAETEVTKVDRRLAGRYLTEVIQQKQVSPVTRTKDVSAVRTFFGWLLDRGVIELNPFDKMAKTVKTSTRGKERARRAWTDKELAIVLESFDRGHPVWALTVIALYTGMRREEVGTLKIESYDAKAKVLRVTEGKTQAAVREVPVHPVIRPLVAQLAANSSDGFLLSNLNSGGPDAKRTWHIGKKFGRDIRAFGITDERLDFHALRGTFITALEENGTPVPTIQMIVGHERAGVTLGYSSGPSLQVRRAAVESVRFGNTDTLVSKLTPEVTHQVSNKRKRSHLASPY
ncbi:tyrosine-type recombinase/integrase [Pseudoxanthomonas mexicana]|uniref:tyrosine-type recombinase/integrase n=1 Tax=Pseudoxanthomonas mexicana TaxID=128785 RepID=UPI0028B047B0|nr:tyrosine-type recombinase/integrase [Pseudoxanthomonas mexicana]